MKRFFTVIMMVGLIGLMFGCAVDDRNQADKVMADRTAELLNEAVKSVGIPAITNFRELRMAKMIYELRDKENLVMYAYNFSEYTGMYTYIGQCIGYGLPYSVQYSNPEREAIIGDREPGTPARSWGKLPQPEPNGLFMPEGLTATWVMLIDPKDNKPKVVYMEPTLTVVPFKLPASCVVNY